MAREQRPARVTTGDRYLDERGLGRVHFLKIDTEGHDLAVLRGASLRPLRRLRL